MTGTVNGVPVISAARVAWMAEDDVHVRLWCESRGLVRFAGGGSSDAVVIGDAAIVWERTTHRFRAFAVEPRTSSERVADIASQLRRVALDIGDVTKSALLVNVVGILNSVRSLENARL